ncbi:DUF6458 family protein [Streptomonospora nanhaiensis]
MAHANGIAKQGGAEAAKIGIGLGIFLMVIGAVLAYGITADIAGLNLDAIGMILMVAGVAVVVITIILMMMRRDRTARAAMDDTDVL